MEQNFESQLNKLRQSLQNPGIGKPPTPARSPMVPPGVQHFPPCQLPVPGVTTGLTTGQSAKPMDILKKYGKHILVGVALLALVFFFLKKKKDNSSGSQKPNFLSNLSNVIGGGASKKQVPPAPIPPAFNLTPPQPRPQPAPRNNPPPEPEPPRDPNFTPL